MAVPKVLPVLQRALRSGPVHITLIDPDKQTDSKAASIAAQAEKGGTDCILVGGTTGVDRGKLEGTLYRVREATRLPLIIFPASSEAVPHNADAIFFMSLLNSRSVRFVIREAAKASLRLSRSGMEVVSVGYIVFEPGMVVGKVGDVDLIPRDDVMSAQEYARACELFGMGFCYLEGGSGVPDPIPPRMISAVRSVIGIPLIVGGGISTPEKAGEAVEAGADIIVTGTMVEREGDIADAVGKIKKGMVEAWKKRKKATSSA